MKQTVNDIAALVGGRIAGEGNRVIEGAAGLEEATSKDITFLKSLKNIKAMETTKAAAILVPENATANGKTLIYVKNPLASFARILEKIAEEKNPKKSAGIHPLAYVAPSAKVGNNVFIGPFCVVENDAEIGDGVTLQAQVYIGAKTKIGTNTHIYPQVVIRENIQIGARCLIHAGAMIGSDGYGFYFEEGKHNKIPQVGSVLIEDDVEIGSCTTIDRATTGATIIHKGTKIDNLVQIAHNVEIGAHSLIVAQVGIAGSSKLDEGVVLAGQVGVSDHIHIGKGAQIGGQSAVKDNVAPGAVLFGSPARPLHETMKQIILLRRLPELFNEVKKLKK